jgi:starch phosphorylase
MPSKEMQLHRTQGYDLNHEIKRHIVTILGNDYDPSMKDTYYQGLAYDVRDTLARNWLKSQRSYCTRKAIRVYYLSLEFLHGRFLMNYIHNLKMKEACGAVFSSTGLSLADIEEEVSDAGLGSGGLGRLASCCLDSMATMGIPAYGYGIRYDYGIFEREIVNGWQRVKSDNWVRHGCSA